MNLSISITTAFLQCFKLAVRYALPVWRMVILVHTGSMTDIHSSSPRSFEQLSVQARTLLSIYASAAWARRHAHIPNPTRLLTELESFWCAQQLSADALSDPHRMTLLLEKHFESLSPEAVRTPSVKSRTCHSRVSQ